MKLQQLRKLIKEELEMAQLLNEIKRLQELAGIIKEEENNDLLVFVKNNKEEISKLNPGFENIIMENGEEILTPNLWTEEDYFSSYEEQGYTYDKFKEDWGKYNPIIITLGEELSTVFITDKELPIYFANTLTGNDLVFFGSISNPKNSFKKYNVNGKSLYIVWGIPDPGS